SARAAAPTESRHPSRRGTAPAGSPFPSGSTQSPQTSAAHPSPTSQRRRPTRFSFTTSSDLRTASLEEPLELDGRDHARPQAITGHRDERVAGEAAPVAHPQPEAQRGVDHVVAFDLEEERQGDRRLRTPLMTAEERDRRSQRRENLDVRAGDP